MFFLIFLITKFKSALQLQVSCPNKLMLNVRINVISKMLIFIFLGLFKISTIYQI